MGPTAIVLDTTTIPISESVPCQALRPVRRTNVLPNSLRSRRAPEPFLEKMIRQVFQSGLDAPIIFAGDEDEAIRIANLAGQALKLLWRFSCRIFLVHAVEHRKVDRLGVDQFDVVAAAPNRSTTNSARRMPIRSER